MKSLEGKNIRITDCVYFIMSCANEFLGNIISTDDLLKFNRYVENEIDKLSDVKTQLYYVTEEIKKGEEK